MNINRPMPLHLLSGIEQLSNGHPVWKLSFGQDALVIKSESAFKRSHVSDPAEVMAAVDPHSQTKMLDKSTLLKLRSWVQGNNQGVDEKNPGFLLHDLDAALVAPLPNQPPQGKPVHFFAMECKKNLVDLDKAGLHKRGGSKALVKKLHEAFKQPGTLEKLGEVLAVDAFIGNQDRVNFQSLAGKGKGQSWPGPDDLEKGEVAVRLECLQNPGNIFLADEQGRPTVLGLDTVDPGSSFKDLNTWDFKAWYPGQILKRDRVQDRRNISQKVMNDMNTIMGPRNRSVFKPTAKKTYMPSDSVVRIERGIVSGGTKLLNYMKNRFSNGGVPSELQFRLNACGWLSRSNFPRL